MNIRLKYPLKKILKVFNYIILLSIGFNFNFKGYDAQALAVF